jgi:ribosomal protein L40E
MFYDGGWEVSGLWPLAYIGMAHSPYFTLSVSVPNQVSVTLDGVQESAGSTNLQLSTGVHTISVPDVVQINSTSRLKFYGWSDGSTHTTTAFDLENDTEISATYITQYLVNATSDSTLQSGWYDQGTVVQFTVNTQLVNQYRLLVGGFSGWYNNGQPIANSPNASLTVNGPVNLTDSWNYLPILIPVLIVVIVAVILFFARRGTIPTQTKEQLKVTKVEKVDSKKAASGKNFCIECGAELPPASEFCNKCGTKQGT